MSTLEQVSSHVYRYEDENICMENLKYDMNVITDPPQQITLKQISCFIQSMKIMKKI